LLPGLRVNDAVRAALKPLTISGMTDQQSGVRHEAPLIEVMDVQSVPLSNVVVVRQFILIRTPSAARC
jgi:hypothetical protein